MDDYDYKSEFKKWLAQQNFNYSTIKSYISLVQRLVKECANSNWQEFSNVVVPLLAVFYEITNREYYIDRVTTWYALDYFDKVSKYIHHNGYNLGVLEPKVTLQLFDGKNYYGKDYKINFDQLNEHLKCLAQRMFNYKIDGGKSVPFKNRMEFWIALNDFNKESSVKFEDAAIFIAYETKGNSWRKGALSQYCNFLYAKTQNSYFLYPSNDLINLIRNENPNKTIDGGFEETRPITGFSARQVKPKPKAHRDVDGKYVYSTVDIAKIFDIDFDTASDLMFRYGNAFKIETVLRGYYSYEATNKCLEEYHHYKDKDFSEKYSDVDYSHEGYKWWYNRKRALEFLGIKKDAFYSHVARKCLHIDYAKGAPKYYAPELEHFKNLNIIKRVSKRKYHKNKVLINKPTLSYK